jgi:hypothetical protein
MSGPAGYTPTVSEEYAERIRRWHGSAYWNAKAEAGTAGGSSTSRSG